MLFVHIILYWLTIYREREGELKRNSFETLNYNFRYWVSLYYQTGTGTIFGIRCRARV